MKFKIMLIERGIMMLSIWNVDPRNLVYCNLSRLCYITRVSVREKILNLSFLLNKIQRKQNLFQNKILRRKVLSELKIQSRLASGWKFHNTSIQVKIFTWEHYELQMLNDRSRPQEYGKDEKAENMGRYEVANAGEEGWGISKGK